MAFFFFLCSFLWIGGNHVKGQSSTEGFISIDCGITSQSSYTDKLTNIQCVSDSQFIDTGINYKIASNYMIDGLSYQGQTVRSFPFSVRNCYTLSNVTDGNKYLIRASFFYGNYDGSQTVQPGNPLLFDLYLGGNFWKTVNISDDSMEYSFEIATVAVGRHISICLINTGFGTPFISTLEMRPLGSLYPEARPNQSIAFLLWYNYGPKANQITWYPDDQYDRLWSTYTFNNSTWNEISTTSPITFYSNDLFLPPIAVLQTAVTPINSTKLISFFKWFPEIGNRSNIEYHFIFHFSELMKNVSRSFTVFCGGNAIGGPFYPQYLKHGFVNGSVAQVSFMCTLYPYANNVDAMLEIKAEYGLKKNWMGDPCLPSQFAWSGLNCSYDNVTASIKFINLSYSGLTGGISNTFSKLQAVTFLNNFSQVIGKGGFGKVYHGVLEDGTEVAVKVASKETSTVR
ncbi:hypothetical protein LUZ60_012575 [Juncus effusus]|nr:hypothetical protein LUZ60_012575 [Juncus effusus]